jgi:hypothetical protein
MAGSIVVPCEELRAVMMESSFKISKHLDLLRNEQVKTNTLLEQLLSKGLAVAEGGGGGGMSLPAIAEDHGTTLDAGHKDVQKEPFRQETLTEQALREELGHHLPKGSIEPKQHLPLITDVLHEHVVEHIPNKPIECAPLKTHQGTVLTHGIGFSGKKKLLSYCFDKMQAYAAIPLVFSESSIFRLRRSLVLQLICQPFFIAGVFVLTKYTAAGIEAEEFALAVQPLVDLTDGLTQLVPFLLGLFIATQLKRWWDIRSQYLQKMFYSTAQLSLFTGIGLPAAAEEIRRRIERYALLSHKMLYLCARRQHDHIPSLVDDGLLTADELEHVEKRLKSFPVGTQGVIGSCDLAIAGVPLAWAAHLILRVSKFAKSPAGHASGIDVPVPMVMKMIPHKRPRSSHS